VKTGVDVDMTGAHNAKIPHLLPIFPSVGRILQRFRQPGVPIEGTTILSAHSHKID
jgi:hypothetical protein